MFYFIFNSGKKTPKLQYWSWFKQRYLVEYRRHTPPRHLYTLPLNHDKTYSCLVAIATAALVEWEGKTIDVFGCRVPTVIIRKIMKNIMYFKSVMSFFFEEYCTPFIKFVNNKKKKKDLIKIFVNQLEVFLPFLRNFEVYFYFRNNHEGSCSGKNFF